MVCKILSCSEFPKKTGKYKALCLYQAKIAILRASMVVTYYVKLFRIGADRHNSILMSLLLLVTETTKKCNRRLHTVRC